MYSINDYNVLHKIYRQWLSERKHFQNQYSALKLILSMRDFKKEIKILDAASGTGDVVLKLFEDGYSNLYAVDASPYMLSQWPAGEYNICKRINNWENLTTVFCDWGYFDVIFFLGHSLPHISPEKLPNLFSCIFGGLNEGGVLAFDIRPWSILHNGRLVQQGREEGVKRLLGEFEVDRSQYWLFEEVFYLKKVQNVQYHFIPQSPDGQYISETLQYNMYHWKDAIKLLSDSGFPEKNVSILEIPQWPYLVITAKK